MGGAKRDAGQREGSTGTAAKKAEAKASPAREEKPRRTCLHSQLHKTKFCLYHLKGTCQYGSECAFAHSCTELQATPDLRKTRLCAAFMEGGGCQDPNCTFAHGEDELRFTDMFYKKTLCIWHEKGRCRNGDQCRFAHGQGDRQSNREPVNTVSRDSPAAIGVGFHKAKEHRKVAKMPDVHIPFATASKIPHGSTRSHSGSDGSTTPPPSSLEAGFSSDSGSAAGRLAAMMRGKGLLASPSHETGLTPDMIAAINQVVEPMKVVPTRGWASQEALLQALMSQPPTQPTFPTSFGLQDPSDLQYEDKSLQAELEKLRQNIAALNMQCTMIKERMYKCEEKDMSANMKPGLLQALYSGANLLDVIRRTGTGGISTPGSFCEVPPGLHQLNLMPNLGLPGAFTGSVGVMGDCGQTVPAQLLQQLRAASWTQEQRSTPGNWSCTAAWPYVGIPGSAVGA